MTGINTNDFFVIFNDGETTAKLCLVGFSMTDPYPITFQIAVEKDLTPISVVSYVDGDNYIMIQSIDSSNNIYISQVSHLLEF